MARFLFIVARQLPSVYEHLCQQFGREPNVEVIMDRRKGDRTEDEMMTSWIEYLDAPRVSSAGSETASSR